MVKKLDIEDVARFTDLLCHSSVFNTNLRSTTRMIVADNYRFCVVIETSLYDLSDVDKATLEGAAE